MQLSSLARQGHQLGSEDGYTCLSTALSKNAAHQDPSVLALSTTHFCVTICPQVVELCRFPQ